MHAAFGAFLVKARNILKVYPFLATSPVSTTRFRVIGRYEGRTAAKALLRSALEEDRGNGLQQDRDVVPERPIADVPDV